MLSRFCLLLCLGAAGSVVAVEPAVRPFGLERRTPWTSSQVRGTPDPPLPYRAVRVFPAVHFDKPVTLAHAPGTDRIFVAEQTGKIFSISPHAKEPRAELFLDASVLAKQMSERERDEVNFEAVYGLAFHPKFAENREFFLCYTVTSKDPGGLGPHPNGTRVTRLKADQNDPPRGDPASERKVLSWLQGGHNGGSIKFGPEGYLYISSGDGGFAYPPDGRKAGQSLDDFLSAVLRVDIDRPSAGKPYTVPADNPFVDTPGALGEIWAYGLRNPWKISFDRKTGALWVGDVGWELWELVFRVNKGENFGWSIMEGRQPVNTEWTRGPTAIVPPTVEIPHTDGASITGGFVYRGKKFPELIGTYLFGDWETRRIWGVKADGPEPGPHVDLVDPTVRIIDFGEDNDGELYLLDYDDGTLHQLARNEPAADRPTFPTKLSATGLFKSVQEHTPADGVLPFSINAEQWYDFAAAERWAAIPNDGVIKLFSQAKPIPGSMFSRTMEYPKDAVLIKTLSLEMQRGEPKSRRRIETQLLHFDGRDWRGYSYEWNDDQTDASLVAREGKELPLRILDSAAPDGERRQTWRFFARSECVRCHNPWAEGTLAFTLPQLNRDAPFAQSIDNQIRTFRHIGLFQDVTESVDPEFPHLKVDSPKPEGRMPRLANPYDAAAEIDARARAYLHVNCAHCHRNGGGGSAYVHLSYELSPKDLKAVGVRPAQGTFGIHNAEVLAPGDPFRSTLYVRLAKIGPGHMPALGGRLIDRPGLAMMHDWIRQLPPQTGEFQAIERLASLDEDQSLAREAAEMSRQKFNFAREFARAARRTKPDDGDFRAADAKYAKEAAERAEQRRKERGLLAKEIVSSPVRALSAMRAIDGGRFSPSIRDQVVAAALEQEDSVVRDLLESYLPESQRTKRLGDVIDAAAILKLPGDAARGKALFLESKTMQCRNCHKIGEQGKELGPDLTHIARKKDRVKLLDSILDPSKEIEPKYLTWALETTDGRVLSGLLLKREAAEVVLKDSQLQEHRFEPAEIERLAPQQKSLMPDLLRDLTAAQAADLLAFLETLK